MYIGADYYPEHWPRERWETDAKLMREAGFTITRLAEFSWCKLEPNEGTYDFAWLDDAIDMLGRHGIQVILCTPTPTMPKWVYDRYPDTVAQDRQGHMQHFGNRQNNCFTSRTYRNLSRTITRKLAEHYANHPNVVGWQLDNELHLPYCFCPSCENDFRQYLKQQYGTIETLNQSWGTIFWSQSYGSFEETHLPRHAHSSPSLELEYKRFHSSNLVRFAQEQADILREVCPNHFITHNMMGFKIQVDYYKLGSLLDIVSFDLYYNYGEGASWGTRQKNYLHSAAMLDFMRSVKHKNFLIMETTAGPAGWETYGRNIRPGELRRMALQNMAHGADGQIWFRWRTCLYGTEQYWHGILGHDGVPGRRYREAAQAAADLKKLYVEIEGSTVCAQVGIILDYEDRWALEQQPNSKEFDYIATQMAYYQALSHRGVNVDYIRIDDGLDRYKVVVLPAKYILTHLYGDKLRAFVENGGTLVGTCRVGVKNEQNVPHTMTLPGYLRDVFGSRVEEYESVPAAEPYHIAWQGQLYTASVLADWIQPEGAQVIAAYAEEGLEGFAAVTKNKFGKGTAFYVGTIPEQSLVQRLMDEVLFDAGLPVYDLPEHVEVVSRSKNGQEYVFIMNHSPSPITISITGQELLTEQAIHDILELPRDGVAVVKRQSMAP